MSNNGKTLLPFFSLGQFPSQSKQCQNGQPEGHWKDGHLGDCWIVGFTEVIPNPLLYFKSAKMKRH